MGSIALIAAAEGAKNFSLVSIDPSTIVFSLINVVILMLLYRFLLHKPVCNMLDKRLGMINKEMDEASAAKAKAEAVEAEYTEKLAVSKQEAQEIVAKAAARAEARGEEIVSEANRNAALIRERAEESIEKEKKRAVNEIKNQISELVILTAEAVAEKEISEDDNRALIDSFLVRAYEEK